MIRHGIINGRFLTQPITGVQRYSIELVLAMEKVFPVRQALQVLRPPVSVNPCYDPYLDHLPISPVGSGSGHLWEQVYLPSHVQDGILFSPCATGPICCRNQVVTIHDAAVYAMPDSFSIQFRTWYKILLPILARRVRKIITVSDFSKRELSRYLRVPESKFEVTYEGKEQVERIQEDESIIRKHQLDRPYLLAVSSMNPSKNFGRIVEAVKSLGSTEFDVVIAGGANNRVFGPMDNLNFPNVKCIGYVTDQQLKALYTHATCFIYPSLYEGFGLPPIEAMACGCPVIVSNVASLPEVCGGAAVYCDPFNSGDMARKISTVMTDPVLQKRLREAGLKRASVYTWDSCAEKTLAVLRKAGSGAEA